MRAEKTTTEKRHFTQLQKLYTYRELHAQMCSNPIELLNRLYFFYYDSHSLVYVSLRKRISSTSFGNTEISFC